MKISVRRDFPLQLLIIALFIISVSIPNSLKAATAGLMAITSVIFMLSKPRINFADKSWFFYLITATVTTLYILVGLLNGAPEEAIIQTFIIYIISPFLWLAVVQGTYRRWGEDFIRKIIILTTIIGCLTVPLFFYLFAVGGAGAVTFFAENANVEYKDGYAGSTMFVYGSMIFLFGGIFADRGLVKKPALALLMWIMCAMAAFTSGRVALVLAVFVGIFVGIVFAGSTKSALNKIAALLPIGIIAGSGAGVILYVYYDVDITILLTGSADHIQSFGGSERVEQLESLLEWSSYSWFMGHGHGVGTDYIRSELFPWRYELIWFATILRTGVLGAAAYSAIFIWTSYNGYKVCFSGQASPLDRFMMGAFISAMIASFTNPYIEGFVLQWMYVIPAVHFSWRLKYIRNHPIYVSNT